MTSNNFWKGSYGILVPNTIDRVLASDGINTLFKDGCETERVNLKTPLTEDQYKSQYCEYHNGNWYWASKIKLSPLFTNNIF